MSDDKRIFVWQFVHQGHGERSGSFDCSRDDVAKHLRKHQDDNPDCTLINDGLVLCIGEVVDGVLEIGTLPMISVKTFLGLTPEKLQ